VLPIRILAGAFGEGKPVRDLWLSPDHAVLSDGALIPVRYLVNGATVLQEYVAGITYFHVELEDADGTPVHDVLLAEGMPAESYLDTGNRGAFANNDGPINLDPDFARSVWQEGGCLPLHMQGPVVQALRRRLLHRAAGLGHVLDNDPALTLHAGGLAIHPFARDGDTWRFHAPSGVVRLRSRRAIPMENRIADTDARRLGVAVERFFLDGQAIELSDPRLESGFFASELQDGRAWRWTDGEGVLRLDAPGVLEVVLAFTLPYWRQAATDLALSA
jgi:hypothetical protein